MLHCILPFYLDWYVPLKPLLVITQCLWGLHWFQPDFHPLQILLKVFRLPASRLHLNDVQNFARFLNGCGLFFVEIISKICFMK